MERAATTLLSHKPEPIEAETLVDHVLVDMGLDPEDPELYVQYFTSAELPPIGIPLHEEDQLLATKRDAGPDATFLTVLVWDEDADYDE